MNVRTRCMVPVGGALLGLSLVVTGCGGGSDDSSSGSSSSKSVKPDFDAAHQAIQALSDAYGQVSAADVAAQKAALAFAKANPQGSMDDPALTDSQEKLTAA